MKIALDDPIWGSLETAYGETSVPEILAKLSQGWDDALANILFWDELYHQMTLYPATYAALPWLWQIALEQEAARVEIMVFLSAVIEAAALEDAENRFAGLPSERRGSDGAILKALEDWYATKLNALVRSCVDTAVDLAPSDGAASHMLIGPLQHLGAPLLSNSIEAAESEFVAICPACGLAHDVVHDEAEPRFLPRVEYDWDPGPEYTCAPTIEQTTRERQVARDFAARFPPNHKVARFLTAWADWSCCDG